MSTSRNRTFKILKRRRISPLTRWWNLFLALKGKWCLEWPNVWRSISQSQPSSCCLSGTQIDQLSILLINYIEHPNRTNIFHLFSESIGDLYWSGTDQCIQFTFQNSHWCTNFGLRNDICQDLGLAVWVSFTLRPMFPDFRSQICLKRFSLQC